MRKHIKLTITIGIIILIFSSIGCSSIKLNCQRGWIGGTYLEANNSFIRKISRNYFKDNSNTVPALPNEVNKNQKNAVLVSRIYKNTPIAASGIKEGDLILEINDKPAKNIKTLRKITDDINPGSEVVFTVYRKGEILKYPVIIGKETYQKWHTLSFGFGFGSELDLIPNPDFNIFSIFSYKKNNNRLELNSPEFGYFKSINTSSKEQFLKNEEASYEGWNIWLVFFGFGGKKTILAQEAIGNK